MFNSMLIELQAKICLFSFFEIPLLLWSLLLLLEIRVSAVKLCLFIDIMFMSF